MRITLNAVSEPGRRYRYYPIQIPMFDRPVRTAVRILLAYATEIRRDLIGWPSVLFIQDADQPAVRKRGERAW